MCIDQDALWCAMRDECFVDVADRPALFGAGVEFAVRESACAALAKAVIGVFDHAAFFEDRTEVETAGRGIFAALKDDRFDPEFECA